MPGLILHAGAVIICPHGAPAQLTPSQSRVLLSGQPAALASDQFVIAGCPFTLPTPVPKPSPCISARWLQVSSRVMCQGQPLMLAPGPSLTQSPEQMPQGALLVNQQQTRVTGS
ncbi:hypothetical protein V8J88_20275 [Massilia sp. W12]|uniref:hypothetical protein n=1 Tax=Massilia sp. W12 TaxID=3126507 RepID=UPI0030CA8822